MTYLQVWAIIGTVNFRQGLGKTQWKRPQRVESLKPKICPTHLGQAQPYLILKSVARLFLRKFFRKKLMAMRSNSPGFIKIDKLSETIGVPMPTLRRWERNESMPASIRFGGRIRYWKVSILKRWIETLESIPKELQAEVLAGLESAAQTNTTTTNNNN